MPFQVPTGLYSVIMFLAIQASYNSMSQTLNIWKKEALIVSQPYSLPKHQRNMAALFEYFNSDTQLKQRSTHHSKSKKHTANSLVVHVATHESTSIVHYYRSKYK